MAKMRCLTMKQMKLNDAFWAHTALKFICLGTWLKNKLFDRLDRQNRFIWVQLVHLYGQLAGSLWLPMNQMYIDVLISCVWQKVCFHIKVIRRAMNLRLLPFHQGSSGG